jgi:hypothetical protein
MSMKFIPIFFIVLSICVLVIGCSERSIKGDQGVLTAALVAAIAPDNESGEIYTYSSYESDIEITPEKLAETLSKWTGLDFFIKISYKDNGDIVVDWLENSTLIANLDDREQKAEFFFFEVDGMRWFMMDTLWLTLKENFNADVYYTMNDGKELSFEALYPMNKFAVDTPYMGSEYYFNQVS